MVMEQNREILQSFSNDVIKCMGDSVKRIILYGSYGRGDYTKHSDMDIMILTSLDDAEIRTIENRIYDIAFD